LKKSFIRYCRLEITNKSSNSHGKDQRELLHKKDSYLRTKILILGSEKTFPRVTLWSVLLYGCETWTLTVQDKKKIEAMEM